MTILSGLQKIETKIEKAFDEYCSDLKASEIDNLHQYLGTEKESIKITPIGVMHNKVGIDVPTLIAKQYNVNKVNYALYDIYGHRAVWVPFTKQVPGAVEGDKYWWKKFGSSSGYNPLGDALREMKKFASYL